MHIKIKICVAFLQFVVKINKV